MELSRKQENLQDDGRRARGKIGHDWDLQVIRLCEELKKENRNFNTTDMMRMDLKEEMLFEGYVCHQPKQRKYAHVKFYAGYHECPMCRGNIPPDVRRKGTLCMASVDEFAGINVQSNLADAVKKAKKQAKKKRKRGKK